MTPTAILQRKAIRIIIGGYLVVLVFIGVFLLTLTKGALLKESLGQPQWALLVGFVFILPVLLPTLISHVFPRISAIKISELVEFSFTAAEVSTYSLEALTDQLKALPDQVSAPEYASMMTSYSNVIIDAVREVQKTKDEILVVDLREGMAWVPPNLYLLALLARDRTAVGQIAFVETRQAEEAFVGMSFPEDIVQGLGERFPLLQEAGNKVPEQPLSDTGKAFFETLKLAYQASPQVPQIREMWLNGSILSRLLGRRMHHEQVEWEEPLSEDNWRYILRSTHPYIAAVKQEQLQFVINQDRMALLVARRVAEQAKS